MLRRLLQLAALAAIAAAAWWYYGNRAPEVATQALTRGDAVAVVYATGVVEPERWAEVTALHRGRIVETCRCEGQDVDTGAVLFRLDDAELRAQLTELQARLGFSEKEYMRAADLLERRVGTRERYEQAFADVSSLRASVAAIESQLAEYAIRAPMAGRVLRIDGEIGEIAETGTALAWIGPPRPLVIVAEVNEEDIPLVVAGQEALIAADAFAGRNLPATVKSITPKGDPVLRTYRVYLALPQDTPLFIGMSVDVNIVIEVHHAVLLAPAEALTDGTLQVVGADGRVEVRAVETGIHGTAKVEILSGAAEGERVIAPATDGLKTGDRVRLR